LGQQKLDAQRKVVLNEKRQGDNEPYGLVDYALLSGLFSATHPYSQSTIGRVADLDRAGLHDAREWFRTRYGPNNAILVLAGDIDVATARPLVEKWFGAIPPGTTPPRFVAPVPVRRETTRQVMHDAVPTTRLIRAWATPGLTDPVSTDLAISMAVLGQGPTSRLYQALVRQEKLAVSVSAGLDSYEKVGMATISVDLAPGIDPARVETRIDALLGAYLQAGPTADEVSRIAMRAISGTVRGLEKVGGFGGKGTALAEGMLYTGDPGHWKKELAAYAAATPAGVKAASMRWLGAGDHRLTILPGPRETGPIEPAAPARLIETAGLPAPAWRAAGPAADRSRPPAAGPATTLRLPAVERATLGNGMRLIVARSPAVPVVRVAIGFPVGIGGDSVAKPGTQQMLLAMLDEGSNGRLGLLDGPEIATRLERLGAAFSGRAAFDRSYFTLSALTPALDPSLALFADLVQAPSFPADQLERVRQQALVGLKAEASDPAGRAFQALPPLVYGSAHPYGRSFSGSGTEAGLKSVTTADLQSFHSRYDPAEGVIFVVGDTDMATIRPTLERYFGGWKSPARPAGPPAASPVAAAAEPQIVLIDRPGAPQAMMVAAAPLPLTGRDDTIALDLANDVFGGLTTSRLFQLLREEKGWSYGARSSVLPTYWTMPFLIQSAVDTDHVGDAVMATRQALDAMRSTAPPGDVEIANARAGFIRSLPGDMETSAALLASMQRNDLLGRPDDYLARLPARLTALPDAAIRSAPLPPSGRLVFVVVGDGRRIEPQLATTGLAVRRIEDQH
jgi:predicted Zn-dependent peptidase